MRKFVGLLLSVLLVLATACGSKSSDGGEGLLNAAVRANELKLGVVGSGAGAITWSDSAGPHTCTQRSCFAPVPTGTVVTLTAVPTGTHTFAGWIGDCAGMSATCSVTLDRSRSVSAAFSTSGNYPLIVTPIGYGTVTSAPAGITCGRGGAACTAEFAPGGSVTLTPTPEPGQTFNGWSGECTGTGGCSVTMTQAKAVTALFSGTKLSLSVVLTGTGAGGVTSSPVAISCGKVAGGGGACGGSFEPGAVVTLTATPVAGPDGMATATWYGDCVGTPSASPCPVAMDRARSVRVGFDKPGFVPGNASVGYSSITAQPRMVPADGTSASVITVKLRDSNNAPLAGKAVLFAASGSNNMLSLSAPTDATGTTTATLASTTAEVKTITATVDGVTLTLASFVRFTPASGVAPTYTVGGTISGLVGSVVLQNNGGDNLTLGSNGTFAFATRATIGAGYAVTVQTQPNSPSQTCVVSSGSGTVGSGNVTSISVSCTTNSYAVGGTLSGLAPGNSVVLRNNGGDNLTLLADGAFTFATPVASNSGYNVVVFAQPSAPAQTCTVTGGSGTVGSGAVSGVVVNCTPATFTVGGTISGLAGTVVLQNNAGDDLALSSNGTFAFATRVATGAGYAVTVKTQPSSPAQTCVVTNPGGTVGGANVTNVSVTCTTGGYLVGGTLTGLAPGATLVLENNGGDARTLTSNGAFNFATPIASGLGYNVAVQTQPGSPSQTCVVTSGSGTVSGANVTTVSVSCTTNAFTIGGTLSGLAGGNTVTLQNNGGNNLSLGADGAFVFTTPVLSGGAYAVAVSTQPGAPSQTCAVTGGSGAVGAGNVTTVAVNCTTNTFTVGGTISGLAGSLVLQEAGGANVTVSANGSFAFAAPVASGTSYTVTVQSQPSVPSQTCVVTNGTGTVGASNVTSISVSCTTNAFTIGGTLSGLAPGDTVVLRNGADTHSLVANGSFTFAAPVSSGSGYNVTVQTQPASPSQTCTVSSASGTVGGANVTNVAVTCTTNTFTVGGTLSGLAAGGSVVLQNNAGDNLPLNANGTFTFATPIASGLGYIVTVQTQPGSPSQTCAVVGGGGTVGGANVTNVAVTCTTNSFSVGGTLSGLSAGKTIVLQNSGGNSLSLSADGTFAFTTPVASGSTYAVTILTQPVGQACTVTGGGGTVGAGNVTSVGVNCGVSTYDVGGTISGLAGTVVLQNNGGANLTVSANGTFAFAAPIASGSPYNVTVLTQPSSQTCTVTSGSGMVAASDVTDVSVTCTTNAFTIGGTLSSLAAGATVVLAGPGGETLNLSANSTFTFSTPVANGTGYTVTVQTQPSSPSQTCTVSGGSGTVGGANITTVSVTCTTNTFTIGGTLTGLAGGSVVLQDNGGDNLTLSSNGTFAFATKVASNVNYSVTVQTQPGTPSQTCTVAAATGTVAAADVSTVSVSCTTNTFTVGGTLSGLAGGATIVLQDNGGNDLSLTANGPFVFTTPVASGSAYAVTILTQPAGQTCSVTGGSGTVGAGNVTSVGVNCTASYYNIGGTISGLAGTVVLQDNGGANLSVSANGAFAFATPIASGAGYSVTVLTQPSSPSQTCVVASGSGTVGAADVNDVSVTCTTNAFTVGGTIAGLAGGASVQLHNGVDSPTLAGNGPFTFATSVLSGSGYNVTVLTQPSSPSQTCTVSSAGGTVGAANVTDVSVTCTTNTFSVGGTLSGLAGGSVVLQDNGGDNLTLSANGTFAFPIRVASGATYSVTVQTQPSSPSQTCTVSSGGGTVGAANVTTVAVTCTTNPFTIGGTLSGLNAGTVVLQNNLGDDLTLGANGSFAFAMPVASGSPYGVTILTQPAGHSCSVSGGSGTVGAGNVTSVGVSCAANVYNVGGTIAGLAGTVVLRDNGGDDLTVSANGSFAFATPVASGLAYNVTVLTQPSSPAQTCVVTSGSGTVGVANVNTVSVACTTNTYTISGTLSGLAAGASVVLANGADGPTLSANGGFTFATPVPSGSGYNVTVLASPTWPTSPSQTCTVTSGSGTVTNANVINVSVTCVTNTFTVGGTINGLKNSAKTVVLQNNGVETSSTSGAAGAARPFTFATPVMSGSTYNVTVLTPPNGQACTVNAGTGAGTVGGANVTSVIVTCL